MRLNLYTFQTNAKDALRKAVLRAVLSYNQDVDHDYNQVISLQAPTGAGKTIIMANLIEDVFCGSSIPQSKDDTNPHIIPPQPNAIFVWLSDSPSLNEQSKTKLELKADKIQLGQCVSINEDSFDMETLEDGHVYFLNTQKITAKAKLGQHSDGRQHTIWETLDNTAANKSDRLYFIIDEAHRGMQSDKSGTATSIMQRFIKGSPAHGLRAMPVIIGMSATSARFNALVSNCPHSSLTPISVSAEQVRSSGLLKDRILVTYPDDITKYNEDAVLQVATTEWMNKCKHWYQYTREQHYQNVDPVFVIQVKAGSGNTVSSTDLDSIINTIEDKLGRKFKEFEVAHTFGSVGDLVIAGLTVHHVEPDRIAEDHRICVVLFKENLSTGWDCPRAETMMSYRTAKEYTYIAQLLGRMVRTPSGSRILVDESLNEVRLYLPFFDSNTIQDIIEELKSSEGENLSTDVDPEEMDNRPVALWSVYPHKTKPNPGQTGLDFGDKYPGPGFHPQPSGAAPAETSQRNNPAPPFHPSSPSPSAPSMPTQPSTSDFNKQPGQPKKPQEKYEDIPLIPDLDRKSVLEFINKQGYLSYCIRDTRINNYLTSLLDLASLLTRYAIYRDANDVVKKEITTMIHDYANSLREHNQYNSLKTQILQMKLSVQMYDVFGESLTKDKQQELFLTDSILDKQCDVVDVKLGRHNYVNAYISRYAQEEDLDDCKIDCILFAANEGCMKDLYEYAKKKFHFFDDENRRYITSVNDACRKEYNTVVTKSDAVSKINLFLPEIINKGLNEDGKKYFQHLYADMDGVSKIKLNTWESDTIELERLRPDFVCWVRNPVKAPWSLTIPYTLNNEIKPMYPDFLVIRSDERLGYVMDILEPHGDQYKDSLAKAKGLAEYANAEEKIGRVQMIRQVKDKITGEKKYLRLDFSKGEVRDEVRRVMTTDEFDHLFEKLGFFDD